MQRSRNIHSALRLNPGTRGGSHGRQQTDGGQGAVKRRSQRKSMLMGKTAWTKRNKNSGEFMDVKKSKKKFKGVRREKAA
jgi:hypothetical protein